MGYCDEAWAKFLERLEVIEGAKGFYLKCNPNKIYQTKEEAEKVSKLLEDMVTIH